MERTTETEERPRMPTLVKLGERDLQILSALETWGILGLGQLEGLLFRKDSAPQERLALFFNSADPGRYHRYVFRCLRRLETAGLIKAHRYVNLPKLLTLTAEGHARLRAAGRSRLPEPAGFVADSLVRHELDAAGVGLVMSELLGLPVRTERERYLWGRERGRATAPLRLALSDLWVVDEARPKAVEVERTQKSATRYRDLWELYRRRLPPGGVVLYIACWPTGAPLLLARARACLADFVYVCGLEEFKASLGTCAFRGYRDGAAVFLKNAQPVLLEATR